MSSMRWLTAATWVASIAAQQQQTPSMPSLALPCTTRDGQANQVIEFLAKDDEDKPKNWLLSSIVAALIIIPLTKFFAPELIPFGYFGAWDSHGTNPIDWFAAGWPILAWGFGVTLVTSMYGRINGDGLSLQTLQMFDFKTSKAGMFWKGFKLSAWAGIAEEIAFRWLLFYGAFASLAIMNFLFFGWAGFGLPEWFHLNVWGAVANWTTFGGLEHWIYYPGTWLIGAAMLYANAFFRDGHKYLGIVGILNSWFIGMFLFYIMFNYGLLAGIMLHFVYDLLIFSTIAIIWGD